MGCETNITNIALVMNRNVSYIGKLQHTNLINAFVQ